MLLPVLPPSVHHISPDLCVALTCLFTLYFSDTPLSVSHITHAHATTQAA